MPALRKKVRRRRKKISCLNCRQKKLKCDKCLPCSRCKERKLEASCVYENNYEAPYSKDDASFICDANQHINYGFESNDDEKFHFYRPLVLFNMIQKCARAKGIPVETLFSSITISGIEDAASYLKVLPPLHIADLMLDLYIERFDSVFPIIERHSVKDTVRCLYNSPPIFPVVGRLELLFVVLWASLKVEELPSSLLEYFEQTGDSATGLAERFRQKIDTLDDFRTNLRHLADINFLKHFQFKRIYRSSLIHPMI
ncbi:hypothetical protein SJAG_06599 [Schizosaccharomyces japonicus yFS275]|uniref:Zn(2)-C6 fungal-type domain-containing protein n=1 Tax=Schizosaccharomyces japonicus (strain yFS275 / FY16936) TaxID=402676 RepID=T0S109_SCHJY|nr:hypothetical protein SJAG_06599 [Schizosaccharomyces japonicus yFS275]EQC53002.1 hypothetical protein SJAG_06599 [Schizosaccharomyces japonicus yFS275]